MSSSYHWLNLVYAAGMGAGGITAHRLPGFVYDYIGGAVVTAGVILIAVNGYVFGVEKTKELRSLSVIDRRQDERAVAGLQRATEQPEKEALPRVNVFRQGQTVYANTVAPVRLDHEQNMARSLVKMKADGFPMNISETYWIREGHWQDGPESFRMTRGKWEYYNIVGKRNGATNARYEVQNERGVELIASGSLRLPPPPQ